MRSISPPGYHSLLPITLKRTFLDGCRRGILPWLPCVQGARQKCNLLAMLAFGEDDVEEHAIPTPEFRKVRFPMIGNNSLL